VGVVSATSQDSLECVEAELSGGRAGQVDLCLEPEYRRPLIAVNNPDQSEDLPLEREDYLVLIECWLVELGSTGP